MMNGFIPSRLKWLAIQLMFFASPVPAQPDLPAFGAQVFIESGQTPEQIDHWFHTLDQSGMKICRIRMFETYMRTPEGRWDFTLFDHAFRSAEKYGIKIYATLFPATPFTDIGGFKFPRDEAHLQAIGEYIRQVTNHFKSFVSLHGWVLINEPGVGGGLPEGAFTQKKFADWKAANPLRAFNEKGYPVIDFAEERFLLDYNTWFLKWIAGEVRRHDPGRALHVNNHQIFQNVAEYDFPAWRTFLTSLGGSAHASWHFGYFNREQYAVAMKANSEIIRSGAGELPWLMTELQGGNNTYSGYNAMCPTPEEIAQWLWVVTGSGGKGAIFWTLNPRASGLEAGEWAMLDFQDQPTERLQAAAEVIRAVDQHASLFARARPVEPVFQVLYVREALWAEKRSQMGGPAHEGREVGGVMKSALGYFEALSELGIPCGFRSIDEFDFSKEDYQGVTIILAHQIVLPSRHRKYLTEFVRKGGKLIVDGLTGFFDENMHNVMKTGFPLRELMGAEVREFKLVGDLFALELSDPALTLPAHLWRGTLLLHTAKPVGTLRGEVPGARHAFGKGEVLWIPSLLGLAARMQDYGPLCKLLIREGQKGLPRIPFRFEQQQPGMLMMTMQADQDYVTILINKNKQEQEVRLVAPQGFKPTLLYADHQGRLSGASTIRIGSEETMVIQWKI